MAAWSDGYVTEIQYTSHYYPEMAPGFMAFACLRQGVRPPVLERGATYLELGCGQGFGLNLLAAANPGMGFWGVDFLPGQVANAERLAEAAGLTNVAFEDISFEQMLALPEGRLPKFDTVALHGVWSWVSPQNRGAIVRILDRVLKPGGMVYVSYNCQPGWAALAPLQRFVADYVARTPGDPQAQVLNAFRAAKQLLEGGAAYFASIPHLKDRIDEALRQTPVYLVHEYLNANSHPFFHADVAAELEGAKLAFAASANIADDLLNLAAPAPLQASIQKAGEGVWRETLLDYASNKPFRRDIFVRGRNRLSRPERDALLNETRFVLLRPPEEASFEFPIPIGQMRGAPAIYGPIIEALADGPRSFGDLAGLPVFAGAQDGALLQAVTLLVGARQIHPLAGGEGEASGAAAAFNRALLQRAALDEFPTHLAAEAPGTAVQVEFADLVALRGLVDGVSDPLEAARWAWPGMERSGRRMMRDGETLMEPGDNAAELAERVRAFDQTKLPLFRALGVI